MRSVEEILSKMTLREKLAQLTQLDASFLTDTQAALTGPLHDMGIGQEELDAVGSVLGVYNAKDARRVQELHLERDRNRIPLLFMLDVIHGFRTIFPIPLALGCSWDTSLAEECARMAAREAYCSGIHVNFSPMTDLVRDARWGRVMESTGEDPLLNAHFARAFVRGYRGGGLRAPDTLASCVKHLAAYGAAEGGRDYNTVSVGERALREYYLPAYRAAIDEGCEMVMPSFNTIDGIPSAANTWLLRGVLRGEWGFDGVVISDWGAVQELIAHGVAADGAEAARKALRAGVDIEMMSPHFLRHGERLVAGGLLDEKTVDEAVLRVLRLKDKLGLFDDPFRGADEGREVAVQGCAEHKALARRAAARSMVLLKNNGLLPLSPQKSVAVIGPYAEAVTLLGGWSCLGKESEAVSLREGILQHVDRDKAAFVQTAGGFTRGDCPQAPDRIQALRAASAADVIILALGEHPDMSGEAASRASISLPAPQEQLAREVLALEKPTVAVLFNGRPLDIGALDEADAILEAWFPGTMGGAAAADLLYGAEAPQGRLSMSIPRCVGQLPLYYNHLRTGRPVPEEGSGERYLSKYLDVPNSPRYPFGFGLTYTTFTYEELTLSETTLTPGGSLKVSVRVRNTGARAGVETVQLYLRDHAASVARPVRQLVDYRSLRLGPGEAATAEFTVSEPVLRFYTESGAFAAEPGWFTLFAGPDSESVLRADFEYRI